MFSIALDSNVAGQMVLHLMKLICYPDVINKLQAARQKYITFYLLDTYCSFNCKEHPEKLKITQNIEL